MACCKGHAKLWAVLTFVSALLLCGSAVYLFISMQELMVSINFVLLTIAGLQEAGSSLGASASSQLPDAFLEVMRQAAPYLDFASMGPAMIAMVFLMLAGGLGCSASPEQRSFCCAKLFVLLSDVALTLSLAWSLGVTIAALMADRPLLTDQWAGFTAVCTDSLPALQQAVDDAEDAADLLSGSGASFNERVQVLEALAGAQAQLDDFRALCTVLEQVPEQVMSLQGAGLCGLIATLLSFVSVNAFCCAAGCCMRRQQARVAPAPEDAQPPAKGGGELELDDYDADLVGN